MLFWTFVIFSLIAVLFIILHCTSSVDFEIPVMFTGLIGFVGVVFSIVFICIGHIGIEGKIAAIETEYDMLVYQLENNVYDNDNDLGKRDLYKDVQEWNIDLARYQRLQDDFWVGIFIPNIYDQFEFIDLEDYE